MLRLTHPGLPVQLGAPRLPHLPVVRDRIRHDSVNLGVRVALIQAQFGQRLHGGETFEMMRDDFAHLPDERATAAKADLTRWFRGAKL